MNSDGMNTLDIWSARADDFASLYRSGLTLQEIGKRHGITREAVRRAMTKRFGSMRDIGGYSVRVARNVADRRGAMDRRYLEKYGATFDLIAPLRGAPTQAFRTQRANAQKRGVEWKLTFWEWWCLWRDSGFWGQRGRLAHQYVMCRFGDCGAYEVGNIYIGTVSHNCSLGQMQRSVVANKKM